MNKIAATERASHINGARKQMIDSAKTSPHSADLRKHRRKDMTGTFFVTKCVEPKRAILTDTSATDVGDALVFYASQEHLTLAAFVVMPDHWHALFSPETPPFLRDFMGKLDHWISGKTKSRIAAKGCQWQDGYYDTIIRTAKQFAFVRDYIEKNPVRSGLTDDGESWPWSSAHPDYREAVTTPWPRQFEKD